MRSISELVDMGLEVATEDQGNGLSVLGVLAAGLAAVGLVQVVRDNEGFALRTWETPADAQDVCTYPSSDRELHEALGRLSPMELERLEGCLRGQSEMLAHDADELGRLKSEVGLAIDMHTPVALPPMRIKPRATPAGMFACRQAA